MRDVISIVVIWFLGALAHEKDMISGCNMNDKLHTWTNTNITCSSQTQPKP